MITRFVGAVSLSILGSLCAGCLDADAEMRAVAYPVVTSSCAAEPPPGQLCGCVYDLAEDTKRLPDFSARAPLSRVCVDSLDVSLRNGSVPGFPGLTSRYEWFGVDFRGTLFVDQGGPIQFRLSSDDGANLVIDGATVLRNDGLHDVRTVETTVVLAPGPHQVRIPYWDGPGPMALVVEAARPGEALSVLRFDRPL